MILFILAFLFFLAYALLIQFYHRHWKALKTEDLPTYSGHTKVSLIIPARNEAVNLPRLLAALQKQSYPPQLLEIILVDDFSTDGSSEIVTSFGLNNLKLVYPG